MSLAICEINRKSYDGGELAYTLCVEGMLVDQLRYRVPVRGPELMNPLHEQQFRYRAHVLLPCVGAVHSTSLRARKVARGEAKA